MSNLRLLFNKNIDLCNNFTSLINNITISTVNIDKTNALRIIERSNIKYELYRYDDSVREGRKVADILNEDENQVFKTLVTVSNDRKHFVFVIPVNAELDLKKAAKVSGVKSIEMIHQKELLPLTGYIHGGCSPIGMKKKFPTFIEESAQLFDHIFISAGKVGLQLKISPFDLKDFLECDFVSVVR